MIVTNHSCHHVIGLSTPVEVIFPKYLGLLVTWMMIILGDAIDVSKSEGEKPDRDEETSGGLFS